MLENGMVAGYNPFPVKFVDNIENITKCHMCGEELDKYAKSSMKVSDGYIHADCLEEYCEAYAAVNDYASAFAMDHFEEFMKFVRDVAW